jgi:hypothetical protein
MTADVRIAIQDYEIVSGAMKNEVRFVVMRVVESFAEEAAARSHFRFGGGDVFVPPGTPEPFHNQLGMR